MTRLLTLVTVGPLWVYARVADCASRFTLPEKLITWVVGMLRWHSQKPGLLASALLVYLVIAAATPVPMMGAVMAQETETGAVIALVDGEPMQDIATPVLTPLPEETHMQMMIDTPAGWLFAALILAALAVLAVLAKGRKASQSSRAKMDPFERLLQRRLAEKAHAEHDAMNGAGLLRA